MNDEVQTKPTIDTLLERINFLIVEMSAFREAIEIRLDRIESMVNQTRAEMLTLPADFREFRAQIKQPV